MDHHRWWLKIFWIAISATYILVYLRSKLLKTKVEEQSVPEGKSFWSEKYSIFVYETSTIASSEWTFGLREAFVIGLVLVVLYFCFTLYRGEARENQQTQQVQPVTVQTTEQHGTLSWKKPEGVDGRNPQKRRDSLGVVVNQNDADVMAFTVNYYSDDGKPQKADFWWNKHDEYGRWSQNYPSDGGKWRLTPYENNEKVFVGIHSDKTGSMIPLRLELD